MYAIEQRKRAVELYIRYGHNGEAVCKELGYPSSSNMVGKWYEEGFFEIDPLAKEGHLGGYYTTAEEKARAVEYYLAHGRVLARTARDLKVPRRALERWIDELAPGERRCQSGSVEFLKVEKLRRRRTAPEDARTEEDDMPKDQDPSQGRGSRDATLDDLADAQRRLVEAKREVALVEEELRGKRMELDLAVKGHDLLKKSPGADLKNLTNRDKAVLVGALRSEYELDELLGCLGLARSTYFYQRRALGRPDKHEGLRARVGELFAGLDGRFGYRTIWALLGREGKKVSEKIVRRIMAEEGLEVVFRRRRAYSSYRGEGDPSAENVIRRDFAADNPNEKWLTDITEFKIDAGKVYLSPVIDCFDGKVVGWTMGTSPNAELVNTMLDKAIATLGRGERPLIHSDRGCHYRWPGWIERAQAAGLVRSMSKKGCSPDNAACEGFFGRLKNEFFYYRKWKGVSVKQFMAMLDDYLRWYNEKRIKKSLGWMSPAEYRLSKGLAA